VDALLYEKDGDVWMSGRCPEHGASDLLYWKDAGLYRASRRLSNNGGLPPAPSSFTWETYSGITTTLAMDPTLRCNLRCPDCFSDAEAGVPDDPTVEEMLARIPSQRGKRFRPNMALVGGESSLREDLPDLIRGLLEKGITPRLNTNGINMLDPRKRRRLREAGLKWVILQFDGFQPEASQRLRGADLIRDKLQAIEALTSDGFFVHLAVMLARGVNDREVGKILEFALHQKGVKRLSFYPRSAVGRNVDPSDGLVMHLADVFEVLETGTGGKIRREDLLETKRLWQILFRLTRLPVFRQRLCILPFVVLKTGDGYLPLNRLFKPSGILRNPGVPLRLLRSLGKILAFDRGAYSSDILLVNIEKFYHSAAFDLDESRNCHHIYVTPKGYIPFCLYNSFYRGGP